MSLEVLVSCMYQNDCSILFRSNIQSDVVVINQCDYERSVRVDFEDKFLNKHFVKFVSVKERGLSKSRNRAIQEAEKELCLLCDDDEVLVDHAEKLICKAFDERPEVDVIAFSLIYGKKKYPIKSKRLGLLGVLKVNSPQIAFRRKAILGNGIRFDERMGSGTGNGGGEENKFLADCLRAGLIVEYVPITIAKIEEGSASQWHVGFNDTYFFNRGRSTRKILGLGMSSLYAVYFLIAKRRMYKEDIGVRQAIMCYFKGIFFGKQK